MNTKIYTSTLPDKRTFRLIKGLRETTLNYNQNETTEEELKQLAEEAHAELDDEFRLNHKYSYYSLTLPIGKDSKAIEVDAIITDKYPSDVMQAIQNNYFADPEDEEVKASMNEMQAWRKMAKEFASDIKQYSE